MNIKYHCFNLPNDYEEMCADMHKVYCTLSLHADTVEVAIESPPVGHERPSELITIARRKLFQLTVEQQALHTSPLAEREEEGEERGPGQVDCPFDDKMSIVSFNSPETKPRVRSGAKMVKFQAPVAETLSKGTKSTTLPSLAAAQKKTESSPLLMRVKLVQRSTQEHVLVLSFPRVVCDYWSSCLFVQQLADAYGKLEKSSKPSLAAIRVDAKRKEVLGAYEQLHLQGRGRGRLPRLPTQPRDPTSRLIHKRNLRSQDCSTEQFVPMFPPAVHFRQVAMREHQLLLIRSQEKLWAFWQSMVTATIRRRRGPARIKVVPPVRIPSGLGEVTRTLGAARPTTARLRPLTARTRPQTGRTRQLGESLAQEPLTGPKRAFQFLKVKAGVL